MASSSSRRIPRTARPLLPLGVNPPFTDSHFASNVAEHPMQSFKLPTGPLLHCIDLEAPPAKPRNDMPHTFQPSTPRIALRPAHARNRSLRLSSGSLYQRAYHREPYPDHSHSHEDLASSPTELLLPPFTVQTSPKLKYPPPPSVLLPLDSSAFWLSMYFCFNLGLTLFNKRVLVGFPFPYTLSALHALFGTIGASILAKHGYFVPSRLNTRETIVLAAFSMLYAVNIAVSNISLHLVTIPAIVRAATPIFTVLFSTVFFGVQSSYPTKISLIPVVAGVGLATFGDYYFTYTGFLLTLLGTLLAAFKTIFTNILQSPTTSRPAYFHNPFDLLYYLSPLACVECLFLAHTTGELQRVRAYTETGHLSMLKLIALVLNGCIAFGLNVVSFSANRRVGALGMTVAANVKQVLTIVFAVFIFDLTITHLNALGIGLTLVGGA
ncbi:TPT domain-containing protein [Mycena indigotica]|uniref:TPT domain-containing protein n=1 Tax=Mycena indigotica TaxID=2126181 RepID=A0A8H6S546_9AGAR|nr:TPT domain-containing protein [Mycena indigotica]KAF7293001.1 TPT domain-containing protein [Mycena indigotica]